MALTVYIIKVLWKGRSWKVQFGGFGGPEFLQQKHEKEEQISFEKEFPHFSRDPVTGSFTMKHWIGEWTQIESSSPIATIQRLVNFLSRHKKIESLSCHDSLWTLRVKSKTPAGHHQMGVIQPSQQQQQQQRPVHNYKTTVRIRISDGVAHIY